MKETYDASPFFGYLVQGVVHLAAVGDVAPDADDAVLVVAYGSATFPRLSDGSWERRVGVPGGGEQCDIGTSLYTKHDVILIARTRTKINSPERVVWLSPRRSLGSRRSPRPPSRRVRTRRPRGRRPTPGRARRWAARRRPARRRGTVQARRPGASRCARGTRARRASRAAARSGHSCQTRGPAGARG